MNRQDLADTLVSAVRQLRLAQGQGSGSAHSVHSAPLSTCQWRVANRLSEADTERLLAAFTAGMSKRKLAERYGISESSVKRLIRQHGASKPSSGLRLSIIDRAWGEETDRRRNFAVLNADAGPVTPRRTDQCYGE